MENLNILSSLGGYNGKAVFTAADSSCIGQSIATHSGTLQSVGRTLVRDETSIFSHLTRVQWAMVSDINRDMCSSVKQRRVYILFCTALRVQTTCTRRHLCTLPRCGGTGLVRGDSPDKGPW